MLDFIAQHVEQKGMILMDQLLCLVIDKFAHSGMFKTVQDLSIFLKMFPDAFSVQNNMVTLISRPKAFQLESQKSRQQNNVKVSTQQVLENHNQSSEDDTNAEIHDFCYSTMRSKVVSLDYLFATVSKRFVSVFATHYDLLEFLRSYPETFIVRLADTVEKAKCYSKTTAAYKLPKSRTQTKNCQTENISPQSSSQPDSIASSNSNSQPNSLQNIESNNSPPISLQQQTLKQRINTLVMKTLADNTEKDRNIQTAQLGDAWKVKVLQNTRVIVNVRDSLAIIRDIMSPKKPSPDGQVVVAVDCEGINLGVKGRLTMLQIGTMQGQAYIFDLLAGPDLVRSGGIQTLLESENVIKVIYCFIN